jgi:hypothetical protein
MLFRFRRMRAMDPLQVAMTGIRMGERYVQIFCSDATLTRGLATKIGLSGVAALAAPDDAQAARAQLAARKAGVLIDVRATPVTALPWDAASFDLAVIDDTDRNLTSMSREDRARLLADASRVLRDGGRAEIIERTGGGIFGGSPTVPEDYASSGGAEGALRAAGFRPVRTLAERDGFRFVEGLKG